MKQKLFNDKRNLYILSIFSLLVVAIILFAGAKTNSEVHEIVLEQFNEQQLLTSKYMASVLTEFLNERTLLVETIARHSYGDVHESMLYEFKSVYNQTSELYAIQFLNESGIVTLGYPEENTPIGYDIYETKRGSESAEQLLVECFETAKNTGETIISRPIMLLEGELGSFIWVPVYENNKFQGVILAIIRISDIPKRYITHDSSKTLYIIDDVGMILYDDSGKYSPGENYFEIPNGNNPLLDGIISDQISGAWGTDYYFEDNISTKRLVAYYPIKWRNQNLSIAITSSESEVDELISSVYNRILIFAVASGGFILIASSLIIILLYRWNQALETEVDKKAGELKKSNLLLQKANEKLLELDRAKSDFLSMVSHELKTPLTAMKMSAEILRDDDTTPTLKVKLYDMQVRNIDRLTVMVNDLLNTSLIETGRMRYNKKMIGIDEVINAAIENIKTGSDKKEINLNTDIPENISRLSGDYDRLVQLFVNLLINAVKFSHQRGSVDIKVIEFDDYIEVSVKDNGLGIPEDELCNIFNKFYQIDSSSTRAHVGSGLGLFIAKNIVEEHGGSINVESTVGEGSIFTVTLNK